MNKAMIFFAFVVGAAGGSAVTWHLTKKRYEEIAQMEINSVKEFYAKRMVAEAVKEEEEFVDDEPDPNDVVIQAKNKPDILEYAGLLNKAGYTNYSEMGETAKNEVPDIEGVDGAEPYVISPSEFGEFEGYERISLTYYADQILADENDEIVDDVEAIVGFESLNHFGEYEEDSVFVRNDRTRNDYEILLDTRNYSDVVKTMPRRMEGR